MDMPWLKPGAGKTRRQIVEFGGLNYTQDLKDGELESASGVSAELWPCLATRAGRTEVQRLSAGTDLFAWEKLVAVDGTDLLYDGEVVGTLTPGRKQFAVVNTKLCIYPDKKYLDLSTRELGDLQAAAVNRPGLAVTFTDRTLTMEREPMMGRFTAGAEVLLPTELGMKAYGDQDLTGRGCYLEVFTALEWDGARGRWVNGSGADPQGTGVYLHGAGAISMILGKKVLLKDTGISGGYALGIKDVSVVTRYAGNGKYVTTQTPTGDYGPYDLRGLYGVVEDAWVEDETALYSGQWSAERFYIQVKVFSAAVSNPGMEGLFAPGDRVTISGCTALTGNNRERLTVAAVEGQTLSFTLADGETFDEGAETGAVTVTRKPPDLDFICESNNRLFGVNSRENTIYASALGDPTNFYTFDGLATDSYAVAVGTAGPFTGCCAYGSAVLCWKENALHKLMGPCPAEYEMISYQLSGVQAGSEKSLVNINETLYYKGLRGIYAYAGGTPKLISGALGQIRYEKAAAGSDGGRYCVSMKRRDTGAWELLTYDLRRGLWMKEDDREAEAFAELDGRLYMLSENAVYALGTGGDDQGTAIAWEAVFTPFYEGELRRKHPSRLLLRLELEPGAWAEVQLARDAGPFRSLWTSRDHNAVTAAVPIRPGRCDRYRLRLRGEGRCVIRGLTREFSLGGAR